MRQKKNVIITLRIAVLESADAETVASQARKGVEFINPIWQPEVVDLYVDQVERVWFEQGD